MKIGERVGAILGSDDKKLEFLGYGTYQGEEIPKEGFGFMAEVCRNEGIKNPCIQLDSGKVVYGCECWWGPEDEIKNQIESYKNVGANIIEVDIDAAREQMRMQIVQNN